MTSLPDPSACPNCAVALPVPAPRFCPDCGQETRVRPPTLMEFAQQFGGAYLSTEGALWRTLKLLLTRPGELTRQYLAGRRKHFVLPLRLLLTVSLLSLLALRLGGAVDVNVDGRGRREGGLLTFTVRDDPGTASRRNFVLRLPGAEAGLRDGAFYCDGLPATVCARLKRRIGADGTALAAELEQLRDRFVANLGATMFLLLPTLALWLKLVYRNRRLRYTEHLVFAMHLHSFWFLALSLVSLRFPPLTVAACSAIPLYAFLAMRRVYGGRVAWRLARGTLVTLLYLLTLTLALSVLGLWTLLS